MHPTDLRWGRCPRCGSTEVYTDAERMGHYSQRSSVGISSTGSIGVVLFVCFGCFHFEEYLRPPPPEYLEKLRREMSRVPLQPDASGPSGQ